MHSNIKKPTPQDGKKKLVHRFQPFPLYSQSQYNLFSGYSCTSEYSTCRLSGNTDWSIKATLSPIRDCLITGFYQHSLSLVLQVYLNGGHRGLETIQEKAFCLLKIQ